MVSDKPIVHPSKNYTPAEQHKASSLPRTQSLEWCLPDSYNRERLTTLKPTTHDLSPRHECFVHVIHKVRNEPSAALGPAN